MPMENTKPCSTREPEAMFCSGQPSGRFHGVANTSHPERGPLHQGNTDVLPSDRGRFVAELLGLQRLDVMDQIRDALFFLQRIV
jgi:hypothetical protein